MKTSGWFCIVNLCCCILRYTTYYILHWKVIARWSDSKFCVSNVLRADYYMSVILGGGSDEATFFANTIKKISATLQKMFCFENCANRASFLICNIYSSRCSLSLFFGKCTLAYLVPFILGNLSLLAWRCVLSVVFKNLSSIFTAKLSKEEGI